uniref:6-phosphogluconate dehydrogenase, decarboxylating n=1 Tax=Neobodo designis TaxID=312471 RepID=A0A7S1LYU7_NEODS|eukprot:CAMPEP_0174865472 /NCGR_PEP_ID=MMETSP1114-20130205/60430_1 /TAXON_ID=312471 /ORGANISM="Neobodo designis, Strain CCAP 1951/1" /LENGTH=472 /DNA_ID=CAMNT_0016100601 /DNA_START=48 /DNA_END=1466 /DNA_ORIENTATION=+
MSCDVGIIGAGVMGSNLALNIAEKGFRVALHNRTHSKTVDFINAQPEELKKNLEGFEKAEDFAAGLKVPRKVLILVPAGKATDAVIDQMRSVLSKNDIIVDTGNAHFREQDARAAKLEGEGLRFLAMGISGGEEGARKGPAFFPGGSLSIWDDIKPIVEAAAAKAEDGRPCVTMNGRGGAGTCVKMYHNAGEYAILQIWGEVFDILRGSGKSNDEVAAILSEWKKRGFLSSYMLDISIEAAKARDADGSVLTDKVLDRIGSKGTGLWSAQEALEAGVPAPSLAAAVISRQLTMYKSERVANAKTGIDVITADVPLTDADVEGLYHATVISIIACYAQMFQCLRVLDESFKFGLDLPKTIATFRAGCILQGYLLKPMTEAFEKDPNLSNLMCAFGEEIRAGIAPFRSVIGKVVASSSTALPVFTASLTYVNAMFQPTLKYGQLVSLQRDVFGRHGFERVDKEGKHNHEWPELQ